MNKLSGPLLKKKEVATLSSRARPALQARPLAGISNQSGREIHLLKAVGALVM
jgi:hypothetical protein